MRVLFATGSPRAYMAPPVLGDEQVNCGPDWADERGADGKVQSLVTPQGSYDLAAVAARLSAKQAPELVVCLVDASWRNVPRNLGAFCCPRVLLVADTHHLASPLQGMLQYASSEPFDRIVLLYDRHHARIFQAAGLRNVFWFPGLTFPHPDSVVRAARRAGSRTPQLAFVGQAAAHHPRRRRMLDAVAQARLPLAQKTLGQGAALSLYGSSLLALNCSLNGDLNLRVFEIIAAGAALLTDRLAPASGLSQLLAEGREMLTYGSAEELVERCTAALAAPAAAAAIGAAGARWFDEHFSAARRQQAFHELVFDGRVKPLFALEPSATRTVLLDGKLDRLAQALPVYEAVQEAHRAKETVRLCVDATVPADLLELYGTLPRVSVTPAGAGDAADFAIFGRDQPVPSAALAWCWDATSADLAALSARLQPLGFAAAHPSLAVFSPIPAAPPTTPTAATASAPPRRRGHDLRHQGLALLAKVALLAGDRDLHHACLLAGQKLG